MTSDWHQINQKFNHLIKQLFHDKDWHKRAEAARELGLMKDGRATNLLCRALQKEEDKTVVNRIIEALGRIGDPKCTMRIIEKLEEELDKYEGDKFRVIYILEALINLKDKRALPYVSSFLNSPDDDLKSLAEKLFDIIEPNWRQIIDESKKEKSIYEIFSKRKK
ncbi:MAG: HEAT repeat domain-containing protein [Promethearchaeia archaeon]